MEYYDLDDLEIDEKTKIIVRHEFELDEEEEKKLITQMAKMINLYHVLEKEIDLEIHFLEGRVNTILMQTYRCKKHEKLGFNACKYDNLLYESLCPLVEEIAPRITKLKNRKGLLWAECKRKCFPDNFEE